MDWIPVSLTTSISIIVWNWLTPCVLTIPPTQWSSSPSTGLQMRMLKTPDGHHRWPSSGSHRRCIVISYTPLSTLAQTRPWHLFDSMVGRSFTCRPLSLPSPSTNIDHSQFCVALKICAANVDAGHELSIFRRLRRGPAVPNVLQLRDNFSFQGPNGTHTVLVHDVLGCLLDIIRLPDGHKHRKSLCHQITRGLAALHNRGIVHGGKICLKFGTGPADHNMFLRPPHRKHRHSPPNSRPLPPTQNPGLSRPARVYRRPPERETSIPRHPLALSRTPNVNHRLPATQGTHFHGRTLPGGDYGSVSIHMISH